MMGDLTVAPCTREAAKYAVTHWHYSHVMPVGKAVTIGAWEDGRFIGAVVFSRGATHQLLTQWGLDLDEGCELTRVALREHKAPVTQIVAQALRILKRENPGLRLVVSFADPAQGHHGGIYQAGGWIYNRADGTYRHYLIHGKVMHSRSVHAKGWSQRIEWLRENVDPNAQPYATPSKHRYLMPLDKAMRRRVLPYSQPYPPPETIGSSRGSSTNGGTPATQREGSVRSRGTAP